MPTADTVVLIYSKIKHFTDTPCWNIAARRLNEKTQFILLLFSSLAVSFHCTRSFRAI